MRSKMEVNQRVITYINYIYLLYEILLPPHRGRDATTPRKGRRRKEQGRKYGRKKGSRYRGRNPLSSPAIDTLIGEEEGRPKKETGSGSQPSNSGPFGHLLRPGIIRWAYTCNYSGQEEDIYIYMGWGESGFNCWGSMGPRSCYSYFTWLYLECANGLAHLPSLWRYRLPWFSSASGGLFPG